MKQVKTFIDKNSTKEFIQGNLIFAIVSLGISLAIIALYVVFGILNKSWTDPLQIVLVVLGGVLLVLTIIMIVSYLNAINKVKDFKRTIIYNFEDNALSYDIYREEEKVDSGKIYYQDLLDYKESKNYIYLRIKNNTWLVVSKEEELITFIESKGIIKHKLLSRR